MANSVDPDQTLRSAASDLTLGSAASDLGLHICKGLSIPILSVIMVYF